MKAVDILGLFVDGLIQLDECLAGLDAIQVRGEFYRLGTDTANFVGYDYAQQCWLEVWLKDVRNGGGRDDAGQRCAGRTGAFLCGAAGEAGETRVSG